MTTIFSHAQTVVLCAGCSTVLCQPTGGACRLTEGAPSLSLPFLLWLTTHAPQAARTARRTKSPCTHTHNGRLIALFHSVLVVLPLVTPLGLVCPPRRGRALMTRTRCTVSGCIRAALTSPLGIWPTAQSLAARWLTSTTLRRRWASDTCWRACGAGCTIIKSDTTTMTAAAVTRRLLRHLQSLHRPMDDAPATGAAAMLRV